MRLLLLAALGLVAPTIGMAQPVDRPVVVELFTSQGCSSCPPADAKVADLARTRPDLLPLTFHVTYWNGLGWRDPFSLDAATERQRHYVALGVSPNVYTPALVVDGTLDVVGSNPGAVDRAVQLATSNQETAADIEIQRGSRSVTVLVGAGTGQARLLLVGYDRLHRTHVGRGENSGRTLEEANVVRSIQVLGAWAGKPIALQAPLPAGEEIAVLLQRADGRIVGARKAHGAANAF
ncbi:MAG: hypothetical protein BGO51_27540 [Rhodospirillales bacterium 69-11]|nr:DUF1223 domain-containing protein [Rhodospirillales bacterium]OJW19123.1 MAG: hypothetical protein BGO51_27540 [Rhodospirillales bacterium 69-11]